MNIDLLVVGKTDSAEIQSLVATYLKRLNFYTRMTLVTLPDLKNTRNISAESQKRQEGELLMRQFARRRLRGVAGRKGSRNAIGRVFDVVAKADEQRRPSALFRDRRPLRFFENGLRPGRRKHIVVADDLFAPDHPRDFRRTALPRFHDHPQRALSSRVDGDSGSVRTACRFRPGLFLRGYVHLAEIDRHFAELPDKIHAEYAVPALSRTGRAVFGCFHNHVVDSDLRTARP